MRSRPPGADDPAAQPWPELTLSAWEDTRVKFHMWTQIVGKIRLALEPMLNHWWQVPLSFLQSSYEGAAELAGWDRAASEVARS